MSHTSPNGSESETMQEEQSETIVSSNDNPIDPVTGLSQRERDYVQQSWYHVRQDLKAAGLGFFHAYDTQSFYHIYSSSSSLYKSLFSFLLHSLYTYSFIAVIYQQRTP